MIQQENRWTKFPGGRLWLGVLVILFAASGIAWWQSRGPAPAGMAASAGDLAGRGGRGSQGNRPQPVSVAEVKVADMPIWLGAIGTALPRTLVTVRSRVDGELLRLHFREGQLVKQGDLLAEIDPRPFEVQLMQASGQLARDTALLKNAEVDLERYRELWAKDAIAKQQLDTQEALLRQYQGAVEADRGQVESAKLQLAYARIVAPASGRLGLRNVDPGNQVHASDANGIATIAQLQPITVLFSVPEANLPALKARLAGGGVVPVEAWDREQKTRLALGRVLSTDNLVDTSTGTLRVKAEFANENEALFPNQFVNVRLLLGLREKATVIPVAAVSRGSKGAYVYVVDAAGAVTSVPVQAGPVDGENMAVEGALAPGARVVIDGGDKLRDGAKVEVITAESRAAAAVKPARDAAAQPPADAEERRKRWAEINARIDRGEFGEEIRKLPEEERKQRMRELRRQRDGGASPDSAR